MTDLATRHCQPCEGGIPALDLAAATRLMGQLDGRWTLLQGGTRIEARFQFGDYWRTSAFVNAVAWIAHTEDHHPEITFGYNQCSVTFWTHAINGLSENDFICAAKVDQLLPALPSAS